MMPVASENAVLDRSAMQRKAEVRAAIIDGGDRIAMSENGNWPIRAPNNHDFLRLKIGQLSDKNQTGIGGSLVN